MRHPAIILISLGLLAMGSEAVRAASQDGVISHQPMDFADLPGWAEDDHAAALNAFRQACQAPAKGGSKAVQAGLKSACAAAADVKPHRARDFFETQFRPYRLTHSKPDGLLTGYFEPELPGSLQPDAQYTVPVLKRPDDLVDVVPATERARANAEGRLASMRKTDRGLEPYFTRAEIDHGALAGRGLELLYLHSRLDAYVMHVQGSGSIRLVDGSLVRIGYAGKNGYPYTSAGSVLINQGLIKREDLTLRSMRAWLEAHPAESRGILNQNRSYIFFERKPQAEGKSGPLGGQGTPLTPRRSLAVDTAFHTLGAPLFVVSETLHDEHGAKFRHLMIAQDVGSAIGGPERGDIFWGTGAAAEAIAGRTKDRGHIFALLPRAVTP